MRTGLFFLKSSLRFICVANSEVPAVARRYIEHSLWVVKTKKPNFNHNLAWPVEVRGGLLQRLETLAEAAQFVVVMEDWRQRRRYWDYAAELILKAATTGKQEDIVKATRHLERALKREGWS